MLQRSDRQLHRSHSAHARADGSNSRRLEEEECRIPPGATDFSVITNLDAQISGNQVNKALHIGGRVTANPVHPFYSQKVRGATPESGLREV